MSRKHMFVAMALVACAFMDAGTAAAQTSKEQKGAPAAAAATKSADQLTIDGGTPKFVKEETPEERAKRVGAVDPGLDPDEHTIYYREGFAYHIAKFEKRWATFDQPVPYVRPFAGTPFIYEVYQVNDNWVWVWVKEPGQDQPEPEEQPASSSDVKKVKMFGRYTEAQINYLKRMLPEFTALNAPDAAVAIRFEESSQGLPTGGSWRNSLAIADMNGDGSLDIIAPPERGSANGLPSIFLGDGKGHWRGWNEVVWPYRLDYGSVAAADFNKDGHMDLAFAVHLQGLRVFLGDGKGHFTDAGEGLPASDWGSRRVVVADVNGDKRPDIVAVSEGPRPNKEATYAANIRLFLNKAKGKSVTWTSIDLADASHAVAGDYLALGKLNGDSIPDVVSANIFFGSTDNVFLSQKSKLTWSSVPQDGTAVPSNSYYFAVATAPLISKKKTDEALLSFVRIFPSDAEPYAGKPELSEVVGVERFDFSGSTIVRKPLVRFPGKRPISGLATGDFNHDGNVDVIFSLFEPRSGVILLGDGKGEFRRATVEGLNLQNQANYDLQVADVNRDGLPDVIVAYESGTQTLGPQNGAIQVFLNRGATSRKPETKVSSAAGSGGR